MIRQAAVLLAVVLFALVFMRIIGDYTELQALRPLAEHYVTQGPIELGAPNIVTGILITYRGFDTLGEVAVLFMVAASVGLLLKKGDGEAVETENGTAARRDASEIVATGMQVLLPLIFIFGAYVILNGHLSAGGGFQGGAIAASGAMLLLLARPGSALNTAALEHHRIACRGALRLDRHSRTGARRRFPRRALSARRRIRRASSAPALFR